MMCFWMLRRGKATSALLLKETRLGRGGCGGGFRTLTGFGFGGGSRMGVVVVMTLGTGGGAQRRATRAESASMLNEPFQSRCNAASAASIRFLFFLFHDTTSRKAFLLTQPQTHMVFFPSLFVSPPFPSPFSLFLFTET